MIRNGQFDENTLMWWKVITLMKTHWWDENLSLLTCLMKYHWFNESVSFWWKFITEMKIDRFNKNLLIWLKVISVIKIILMKILNCVKESSIWWKFITLIKIGPYDENLLIWWKFTKFINSKKNLYWSEN